MPFRAAVETDLPERSCVINGGTGSGSLAKYNTAGLSAAAAAGAAFASCLTAVVFATGGPAERTRFFARVCSPTNASAQSPANKATLTNIISVRRNIFRPSSVHYRSESLGVQGLLPFWMSERHPIREPHETQERGSGDAPLIKVESDSISAYVCNGNPLFFQAANPPASGRTRVMPLLLSSSATRALVASFGQVQ